MDFFPTFMKLLDIELPNIILDGENILPLLYGNKIEERPLFWHFPIYLQAYDKEKDEGRGPIVQNTTRFHSIIRKLEIAPLL